MKKILVVCISALLLFLVFVSPGFAESAKKNIDVVYNNIQLVINGKIVIPRDVNGTIVEPFIYEGTTYLPVRAVSEALGNAVEWDGDTRTVYVSGRQGQKTSGQVQQPQQTPQQTPSTTINDTVSAQAGNTIVFVSSSSGTIHTVSNCSGMKN
ncbi:MAG: copper amine oxidase N-terminal domain-containing protein, partial [Clostridiales bacterium]|nr:copper amine oxidase N-terminal domain-containing protein [Clostridiales bacterium]